MTISDEHFGIIETAPLWSACSFTGAPIPDGTSVRRLVILYSSYEVTDLVIKNYSSLFVFFWFHTQVIEWLVMLLNKKIFMYA
jgi:hypothetical protein